MIKDLWVAETRLELEDGDTYLLKYYVRVIDGEDETPHPPVYGLKIEKYAESAALLESESTPGLTADYEEAAALAQRFMNGSVTPMSLLTLADEWLF